MTQKKRYSKKAYLEKLRDPRWQQKRLQALDRARWRCQWCRDTKSNLQVHHGFYDRQTLEPWEYPEESLFVLCDKCHEDAEAVRLTLYREIGCIHPRHHQAVRDLLKQVQQAVEEGGADVLTGAAVGCD